MDHNKLHQIVTDAEGVFCGGYVRAWLSAGEPVNEGFRDIDVIGVALEKRPNVSKEVYELTGRRLDFSRNPRTVVFYANTWLFDGKSFYQNDYADPVFSPEETLEQIKQKQAVLMPYAENEIYHNSSILPRFISKYGWTVHLNNLDLFNILIVPTYYFSLEQRHSLNIPLIPSEQIMLSYALSKPKRRVEKAPTKSSYQFVSIKATETKEENNEPPPLTAMARTITRSASNWIQNGIPIASKELLEERQAICKACEFWNSKALKGTGRCMKCGCSTWAKLRMATEKCPIGKW